MPPARFVSDAMLGSLARKLRIFGFDTTYFREGPDKRLLELAKNESRVILTSDRALAALAARRGVRSLLIEGANERDRLRSLRLGAEKASLSLVPGPTRCALCNIELAKLEPSRAKAGIPSSVARSHRAYYRCPQCSRLYWKGSHWRKLKALSALLD